MKSKIYFSHFILFACLALTSCIYENYPDVPDDIVGDVPKEIQNGYSLALNVTLDKMGGISATRAANNPMEEIENYINPEKFRVLFFDHQYRFLFESKSRWVKLLSQTDDETTWFVSVPIFSYGNDVKYEWPWEEIKKAITVGWEINDADIIKEKKFYIAILANRPTVECFPDLDNVMSGHKNFDNSGPHWFMQNSQAYDDVNKPKFDDAGQKINKDVRSVFDLHHCQWDPIYTSKNAPANDNMGFYEIVMGVDPQPETENGVKKEFLMGATSCWVDHGPTLTDDGEKDGFGYRYSIQPDKDYPIPMYGIQEFDAIPADNWTEGTPFNLSKIPTIQNGGNYTTYKSISLLRSVVKLELLIPKSYRKPKYIGLNFSNIYARCEPMDVWTPTDVLWKDHDKGCEWETIWKHDLIGREKTKDKVTTYKTNYWERIWWFYGAWLDLNPATEKPWWNFNRDNDHGRDFGTKTQGGDHPRIFNPCIQRNQTINCEKTLVEDDEFYHYIVYTGERNVNDPSNIRQIDQHGTVIYWLFSFDGDDKNMLQNADLHCIPIADYHTDPNPDSNPSLKYARKEFTQFKITNSKGSPAIDEPFEKTYEVDIQGGYKEGYVNDTPKPTPENVQPANYKYRPYPLLRNHVYKLTLGPATKSGDTEISTITSQELHSESIRFY